MIMNEWNAHFIKRYKYKYGMAKSAVEKTHILMNAQLIIINK